jgi:hypothetical protein
MRLLGFILIHLAIGSYVVFSLFRWQVFPVLFVIRKLIREERYLRVVGKPMRTLRVIHTILCSGSRNRLKNELEFFTTTNKLASY